MPFDFEESKKSNILVSGTNNTGKTRLACGICSILEMAGWRNIVFDNSGVWKSVSDLPFYIEVEPNEYWYKIPIVSESIIYDISNLVPESQKTFVDFVLRDLWESRDSFNIEWVMVSLEEFELYGRSTRGTTAQNIFRIMHAGRNRQIRVLAISTDLALIDSSFIRLCGIRYHGRLNIEENSKRKYRSYYGKEWLNKTINLELGQFVYLNKNKLETIRVPCFEATDKPIEYTPPIPEKPKGFWSKLLEGWHNWK